MKEKAWHLHVSCLNSCYQALCVTIRAWTASSHAPALMKWSATNTRHLLQHKQLHPRPQVPPRLTCSKIPLETNSKANPLCQVTAVMQCFCSRTYNMSCMLARGRYSWQGQAAAYRVEVGVWRDGVGHSDQQCHRWHSFCAGSAANHIPHHHPLL